MNEKIEKDGTEKLQSSAGIAKTEGSTAATCAQTSADADRASRTIPAAASRRLGAATALYALLYTICLYRNTSGITYPFSLQEPCTILTIVPQSAGFHPTETVCKRSLSGRFHMGRQNFCSVSPCF